MNFILSQLLSIYNNLPNTLSLAWILAWRDFQARYIGSKAGYFWAILSPALYAGAFIIIKSALNNRNVFIETGKVNPAIFAFYGVCMFHLWFDALTSQLNHLQKNKSFLKNIKINPEIFAFSQMLLSLLDLAVRATLIIITGLFFGITPQPSWIPSLLFMVMIVFSGNVIGYILSFPSVFYSDISKFINSISFILLICSPVFYQASASPDSVFYWIQIFNPFSVLLVTARDFMFEGSSSFFDLAIIWCFVLSILFVIAMIIHRVTVPFAIERL